MNIPNNIPNKITMFRIFLAIITIVLLIIPWYQLGIHFPTFSLGGKVIIESKYIYAGIFFLFAALTDFIDGYVARNKNMITDYGKVMDIIADKILVNGVLIILAYDGFISCLIPVVIVLRDIVVNSIQCICASKGKVIASTSKAQAAMLCMMIGITSMLFYNIPFELIRLPFADILICLGCILSVVSGCEYYYTSKNIINKSNS